MKFKPDILSPAEIIEHCIGLDPNSDLVLAAKAENLRQVDEFQKRADPDLALLFNSLYAYFHYGPDVMMALAKPSQLLVDFSDQKLQLKPEDSSA